MEYRELEFTSPREEKDFGKWLTESPFNPMACAVPRENIAWEKVLNLFRSEEERKKEGWYCSFQDVYGELLAEFSGEAAPRPPLEDQMAEAMQVLHGSVRLGASKVMQLARRGYPPAMALASDFFAHDFVLHSGKVRNDLAFRYARDAVDAGYEGALAMLGFYSALGIGAKKDSQKAIELLQKGNDCRHPGNYRFMALVFGYGILTEKDPQAAMDYVSAAMQEGDLFAFLAMRDLLNNGLLPQDEYEPPELTTLPNGVQIDARIYPPLQEMYDAMFAAGYAPFTREGFRTFADQQEIMETRIARHIAEGYSQEAAKIQAEKYVAIPGKSEHQTGLAVDINASDGNSWPLYGWLSQHAYEYGFILRYPQGAEGITGYQYEPWHYRYVGKAAAAEITAKNITLEEYLS